MKKNTKSLVLTFIGCILAGYAVSCILLPNKIVNGGVSGLSTVLYYAFGFPAALSNAVLNVVLLLFGFRVLGGKFVLKTVYGAGIFSIFIQLCSYLPPLTGNPILAVIFGGILYGFGIGLALTSGATTGGTDIAGRLIQYKFPYLPIGKLLLLCDGCVIVISLLVFRQIDLCLYGVIAVFVSTFSVDYFIRKLNISKLAFVITDKGGEISQKLISTSPRGVTAVDVVGAYTGDNKKMLVCALKENEITAFQDKIIKIDPDAFIIFSESQQIVGNGFFVYR